MLERAEVGSRGEGRKGGDVVASDEDCVGRGGGGGGGGGGGDGVGGFDVEEGGVLGGEG